MWGRAGNGRVMQKTFSPHCRENRNRNIREIHLTRACLSDRGFTLFEVLLAFFIFSILFVTIYTSYSGSFKTVTMTENRMELYRKAATALERISEDLQASYISVLPPNSFGMPAAYTRFLGEETAINGQEANSLSFYSRIPPLFEDEEKTFSGQLVEYTVAEGNEAGGLVLLRSEFPEFTDAQAENAGLVLADGLQSVTFTYLDENGEEYENWDTEAEEFSGRLPRMVTVSLQFLNSENPDAPLTFVTGVEIPVNYRPKPLGEGQG
jgi:general secretion pathway protein J